MAGLFTGDGRRVARRLAAGQPIEGVTRWRLVAVAGGRRPVAGAQARRVPGTCD
ncbi:hypothetical protein PtoMrB4_53240 [Metapseudomonas otitidis]|uniref:Uncharacterized protein n=1 Tax=Metapseudomonas otitidis TaxID=319939 RepID=A0A679GXC5_9GAMM|nr:hypothetical protein PtoMrB4_53240 [Pseudomonas otitidis]